MPDKPLDLDKELVGLNSCANKLAEIVIDMLPQAKFGEYDHLKFMGATFVCKQLEHLKSILILVDAGQYNDAWSIARVMVEGLAILQWANTEPSKHPLNWRAYVWVDQFKMLYGTPEYDKHKAEIDEALDKQCRQYLKAESKDKPQKDIIPDDYLTGWRREDDENGKFINKRVINIFKDVGLENIHEGIYSPASGWIHWDSMSMAKCIERSPEGAIKWTVDLKYLGAAALSSGIHALYASAMILDGNFDLGFASKLTEAFKTHPRNA